MIIITRKPNYIHLTSDDKSLVLTCWDKEDVITYAGSKHIYCKSEEDASKYYEITEAEHFDLEAEKEKAEMPEMEDEKETEE